MNRKVKAFARCEIPMIVAASAKKPVTVKAFYDHNTLVMSNALEAPFSPISGDTLVAASDETTKLSVRELDALSTVAICPHCHSTLMATAELANGLKGERLHCVVCGEEVDVEDEDIDDDVESDDSEPADEESSADEEEIENEDEIEEEESSDDDDEEIELNDDIEEEESSDDVEDEIEDDDMSEESSADEEEPIEDDEIEDDVEEEESDTESEDEINEELDDENEVEETESSDDDEIIEEESSDDGEEPAEEGEEPTDEVDAEADETEEEPADESNDEVEETESSDESEDETEEKSDDAETDEKIEASVKTKRISYNFMKDAKVNANSIDIVANTNKDAYYIMQDFKPVATMSKTKASSEIASIFNNEAAMRSALNAALENGFSKEVCASFGINPIVISFRPSKAVRSEIANAKAKMQKEFASKQQAYQDRLCQSISIAAVGVNKGIYGKNSLKDALAREATIAGMMDAEDVVNDLFAKYGEDYLKSIIEKAKELVEKSDEVRNETASFVETASFNRTISSDVAKRLSNHAPVESRVVETASVAKESQYKKLF